MTSPRNSEAPQGLARKMSRCGVLLGGASAAEQALRFVRNMILARLLAPEAFGLMAIVLSVCALFQVLTGLGIKEAVIQNPKGSERTYLNGAWWLAVARGAFLYIVAFMTAPLFASFYEAADLKSLLRIAFINVLAQGMMSVGVFTAVKEMRYWRPVLVQQGGGIIGIATSIVLAFRIDGPSALVIGYATEAVARCILSHILCPFRPGLRFEPEHLRALLRFAGGMFGLPILYLIFSEGSVFAMGKLCTKHEVGLFAVALTLARVPSMFAGQMVELLMPAFAQIQGDRQRVNQGLLKVTTPMALIGLPAFFFTLLYGREILTVVYGMPYAGAATALVILIANEILITCGIPLAAVYMAMGRPTLLRRFSLIRAAVMLALLYPAIKWFGLVGAALVPLTAMSVALVFQLFRMRSLTGLNLKAYIEVFVRGLVLAIPAVLVWVFVATTFRFKAPAAAIATAAGASAVLYLAAIALLRRTTVVREYFWPFLKQERLR
jgi:lipopolysaccharide exporter